MRGKVTTSPEAIEDVLHIRQEIAILDSVAIRWSAIDAEALGSILLVCQKYIAAVWRL